MTEHQARRSGSIQFLGWAVLFTMWFNLGFFVLLNSIVLRELVTSDDGITLPTHTRDAVWLVVVIWLVAYIASFIIGFTRGIPRRDLIGSSVLGYLIAIFLHLSFLGVFPGTPTNSYDVLRDFVSLEPLPIYYIFTFLTLILGPLVAGLATYTGTLIAAETDGTRLPQHITVDASAVIFAAIVPFSVMFLALAIANLDDLEEVEETTHDYRLIVEQYNEGLSFDQQEPVPEIVFLHIDDVLRTVYFVLLALVVGIIIAAKRTIISPVQAGLSAALGVGISMLMTLILLEIIEPSSSSAINYRDVHADRLGELLAPSVENFAFFWFVPPIVAGATAFITKSVVNTYFLRDSQHPQTVIISPE